MGVEGERPVLTGTKRLASLLQQRAEAWRLKLERMYDESLEGQIAQELAEKDQRIAQLEAELAEARKQAIPWRDGSVKPGIIGPIIFVNHLGYPISANYSNSWIIGYGTWERVKPIAWCYQNEFADAWSRITEPTQ